MSSTTKSWVVGVDLRPECDGAVAFACSVVKATDGKTKLLPVHVLENDHLQAVLQHHHLAEVTSAAKQAMVDSLTRHGTPELAKEGKILEGGTAEGRIELTRQEFGGDVVVVNRFATASRRRLRRLGRVARRVLRRLNSPVITVPPGFTPDVMGKGPVVATTNLTQECDAAVEFAGDVAKRLGRELVILHVRRVPDEHAAHYLPDDSKVRLRETRQAETEKELDDWVEAKGHTATKHVALLGEVVGNVTEYAAENDACLIVAGSRRLSKIERFLLTSVGRGLSATAHCPVAVVPPAPVE